MTYTKAVPFLLFLQCNLLIIDKSYDLMYYFFERGFDGFSARIVSALRLHQTLENELTGLLGVYDDGRVRVVSHQVVRVGSN